ncbi:MAG: serine/threonine-protein kinase [Planctomycetota bacterium]
MTDAATNFCRELALTKGSPPIVGGIVLHRVIGSGGMGVVYHGSHLRLRIPVAVKFLFDDPNNSDNISRFVNEAALSAHINSPFVVRVYDVNKDEGFQYIVLEYVDGESAEKRLCDAVERSVPLSEEFVLNIAADTTRGLEAIHTLRYLHLDIKPVNLMVCRIDGVTKILDFGLAQPFDPRDVPGALPPKGKDPVAGGTPGYSSPEQLQLHTVGPSSDIYSLGVTAFELLSGRRAYHSEDWNDAARLQSEVPLPDIRSIRPDVSSGTAEWIARCVCINPMQRFGSAMESLAALSTVSQANVSKRIRIDVPIPPVSKILSAFKPPYYPPDAKPNLQPVVQPKAQPDNQSPMVFCVDNDLTALTKVVDMLFEAGYWVEAFANGAEVLNRMRTTLPDLVLIEIDLPLMNGLQVCSMMRANPLLKHIPVVFLSQDMSSKSLKMALHEGASDYLFKPVQPAEVLGRVQCLTRLSRAMRELVRLESQFENFQQRLSSLTGTKLK